MSDLYEYELGHAAMVLCKKLMKMKPGETCIVTADTESDLRVVNAIAGAAYSCGAKPVVVTTPTPPGVGKAADAYLPVEALTGVLREADVWIELNNGWLLYSTPYDVAMKQNQTIRHKCLVGMNVDMMVRCIGRIDHELLGEFLEKVCDMTAKAKKFRFTTPAGENLEFENSSNTNRVYGVDNGYADVPGSHMMSGQIGWTPEWDTINGKIVFDGSLDPPIGLLDEPVLLYVEKGKVIKIEGGREAKEFEAWLSSFKDPQMFILAHVCWGFNPGARLGGNILEDERVWGSTEWGLGNIGSCLIEPDGIPAASHTDGICLNTSAWLDEEMVLDEGKVVHPDLIELSKKLGK
jgi:leucyl aminopeptidase (aminopeptidase T)